MYVQQKTMQGKQWYHKLAAWDGADRDIIEKGVGDQVIWCNFCRGVTFVLH